MTRDLAETHEPVNALFRPARTRDDWERHRLGDEQVEFFRENGYLTGVRVLEPEHLSALRDEVETLAGAEPAGRSLLYEYHYNESTDPNRRVMHCLGHWRVLPAFHDLLWSAAFTVPAAQLLGGAVRFWHDQVFYKPAREGGVVAWHQDYSYWTRTRPLAHLTCWIALDDSTLENGCVHYVPGSHRWPLLPKPTLAGDMDAIQSVLSPEQKAAFRPVPIVLPAGHASFHHPLTLHGSYENRSGRLRRGAVVNVVRDGVASASVEPLLEGVPAIPPGDALGGPFFPLLLDPARL